MQRHTGAGGFVWSSAIEDDFLALRDFAGERSKLFGTLDQGTGDFEGVAFDFVRVTEINDGKGIFGGVEKFMKRERGNPVNAELPEDAPALDIFEGDVDCQAGKGDKTGSLAEKADLNDQGFDVTVKQNSGQHVGRDPERAADCICDEKAAA